MIQKVVIKNFKSLKQINCEVPQFSVIVGYNGAGKTNLLTAIKLISLLANGKQIGDSFKALNIWPSEFFFDPNNPRAEFNLELMIKSKSVKYSFDLIRTNPENGFIVDKELLLVQNEEILKREGNSPIKIKQDNSQVEVSPIVGNQLALSVLEGSKLINEVKDWLSKIIVETFEPNILKNYGIPPKDSMSLSGALAEKLYYLKNNEPVIFEEVVSTFKKIIPGLEKVDVELLPNEGLLVKFKETSIDREYRSFSASNGNLRAMGIISAMFGKPKLSAIFVDEIENSLHPSRIKSVINFLKYLAEDETDKLQVVMTTHNPVLLDYVTTEQIIYCYKKNGITHFENPYKNATVKYHLQQSKKEDISLRELFASGLLEEIFTND